MLYQFIRLEFLKIFRSTAFAKSVMVAIFMVFMATMLLGYLLLAGLFLNELLEQLAPNQDSITVLNANLIFFFLAEFMFRYFIQKLPVIDLESFLHLPVSKRKIMHMLLGRSFFSPITLVPALLFGPFAFQVISTDFGVSGAFGWFGTVLLIS